MTTILDSRTRVWRKSTTRFAVATLSQITHHGAIALGGTPVSALQIVALHKMRRQRRLAAHIANHRQLLR